MFHWFRTDLTQDRLARQGEEAVDPARATTLLWRRTDLESLGFVPGADGFERRVHPAILQRVALLQDGTAFALRWGLSLAYVPSDNPWHLFVDTRDGGLTLDGAHGDACFKDDLNEVWGRLQSEVHRFLQQTRDLAGVVEVARGLLDGPRGEAVREVLALTRARAGAAKQVPEGP